MADEGKFPKINGDIYYADDANITFYQELNSGTMNYGAVTISTSATTIKASNGDRKRILIRNNHVSESLYIGDSGVTTSDGKEISPGQSIVLFTQDTIYGIADSSLDDVRYLEVE